MMSPIAKMPGDVGLEFLGVGRDQVLVQVEAPVGDRAELHRQPEERQQVVAFDVDDLAVLLAHRERRRAGRPSPFSPVTWPSTKSILPCGDQFAHRVDRMRRGAERVAAMDQRDPLGDRMQVQHPVERRIAAADDRRRAGRGTAPSCARRRRRFCPRRPRCRGSAASSAGTSRRPPRSMIAFASSSVPASVRTRNFGCFGVAERLERSTISPK